MHTWLVYLCQVWSFFWPSAQTYDIRLPLSMGAYHCFMSCYLFRALYIFCTACRKLAHRLMFFVLHTTRNRAYLILSYLILSYLILSYLILSAGLSIFAKLTLSQLRLFPYWNFILGNHFGIYIYHNYIKIQNVSPLIVFEIKFCLTFDIHSLWFTA